MKTIKTEYLNTALRIGLAASIAVALCAPIQVLAEQGSDPTLQEIVVTATKRADPLSKVPISIAAYTRESMDSQGVRSVQDIVAQTPGVDLEQSPGKGSGMRISIRGIDSNAGAATTGVYIDDTPIQARNNPVNFAGTSFPEVFDLERVEVLRGPQGTLFGSGAEGGVVRFVTVQPGLDKYSGYARAEVSATEHGRPSAELGAAFGGPIVDGILGFRVSAWDRHDGGYIDRISWETHQNFPDSNWNNSKVVRGALSYAPTDAITITPAVQFQENYAHDASTVWNLQPNPSEPQLPKLTNGFQLRQPSDDTTTLASLKIEARGSGVTSTSISSYFHRNNISVADVTNTDSASVLGAATYVFPVSPAGGLYTVTSLSHASQDVYTEELRLQNSDSDATVKWLGGLFYSQARLTDSLYQPALQFPALLQQVTGLTFQQFFGGDLLNGIYEYTGDERSTDTQVAAFGNVDYRFAEQWTLTAGARFAMTKVKYNIGENGPEGPRADVLTVTAGDQVDHPVTPKIGLTWQPDERNMLYTSIAKGYRIGGVNDGLPAYCGAAAIAIAKPTYQSDTTVSYEIGSKSRPAGGKLQIDASVYHIDWKNIQQYLVFPCLYGYNANSGTARSDGFDLSVNAQLTSHLTGGATIGFTKAQYTTMTTNPNGQMVTSDGQTLGQAPWKLFGFAQYRFPLFSGQEAYLRLQDKYESRNHYPFSQQNPNSYNYDQGWYPNDAVNQLDFRTGVAYRGFDVSLFVDNIGDREPRLYLQPRTGSIGSPLFINSTIRPRTLGLTATYHY
jgi:iron complex outermembrane receptor protein